VIVLSLVMGAAVLAQAPNTAEKLFGLRARMSLVRRPTP
jgi:hypothetical protein